MSDKQTAAMLDKKLDEKTAHTMFICGIVMVIAVLIHDGDHIRQALNWGLGLPHPARDLGAESHRVHLPCCHHLPRQIPPHVRHPRRGDRRYLHTGVLPGPASLRLGHRSLGRVELLLLCTDERRGIPGQFLSGRGLAELGAAVPYGALLRALRRDRLQALAQTEKGSAAWIRKALSSAAAVRCSGMRRRSSSSASACFGC